jgi:hypothetical protein
MTDRCPSSKQVQPGFRPGIGKNRAGQRVPAISFLHHRCVLCPLRAGRTDYRTRGAGRLSRRNFIPVLCSISTCVFPGKLRKSCRQLAGTQTQNGEGHGDAPVNPTILETRSASSRPAMCASFSFHTAWLTAKLHSDPARAWMRVLLGETRTRRTAPPSLPCRARGVIVHPPLRHHHVPVRSPRTPNPPWSYPSSAHSPHICYVRQLAFPHRRRDQQLAFAHCCPMNIFADVWATSLSQPI